jgi:hypothetical protein
VSSIQVTEHFDSPVQPWRLLLDEDIYPVHQEVEMSEEVERMCAAIDQELAEHEQSAAERETFDAAPFLVLSGGALEFDQIADGSEAA